MSVVEPALFVHVSENVFDPAVGLNIADPLFALIGDVDQSPPAEHEVGLPPFDHEIPTLVPADTAVGLSLPFTFKSIVGGVFC